MNKSELTITSAPPQLIQNMAALIQCKPATLPIKYLGLPLSQKGLQKADYLLIVDRIQAVLTGWKASLLSVGGRLVLTNAVLSSIPQYIMSAFLLPKWVLHKIDQIRKRFLWHGHKEQGQQNRALYMVNWKLATRPRQIGGLGVRDLQIANHAMLMRWMWQWYDDDPQHTWWKMATTMTHTSDKPWNDPQATAFWKNIGHIAPAFHCSTTFKIGNGKNTRFWHDNWLGETLKWKFPNLYKEAPNKQASVHQCINGNNWFLTLPTLSSVAEIEKCNLQTQLQRSGPPQSQLKDEIVWIRSSNSFSVSSTYKFISQTPGPKTFLHNIWQIKAPMRVTIFAWLLLTNRLPTIDNLVRRGWSLPNMCVMCKSDAETVHHLFAQCPLAQQIRDYILAALPPSTSLPPKFIRMNSTDMLTDSNEAPQARKWEITTCYILWRERCRRVFSDKNQPHMSLFREIKTELRSWFQLEEAL